MNNVEYYFIVKKVSKNWLDQNSDWGLVFLNGDAKPVAARRGSRWCFEIARPKTGA
jgi:hypothetical protein